MPSCSIFILQLVSKIICTLRVTILGEVLASSQNKVPVSKSLLVLGDNEAGKTSLIAKGQGIDDPKKGAALEYMYINVKDEYNEGLQVTVIESKFYIMKFLKYLMAGSRSDKTWSMDC